MVNGAACKGTKPVRIMETESTEKEGRQYVEVEHIKPILND